MNSRSRDGRLVPVYDGQGKIVRFLYKNPFGQQLCKLLTCPTVSRAAGWFLSRRISTAFVGPFIRKNQLDMSDYPKKRYCSFNDFFTRTILPERRPADMNAAHLIAPCDGKLTAMAIEPDATVLVKGNRYTMEQLLGNASLARQYQGGWLLLFRLSVDDYHRYCYVSDGVQGERVRISGVYHTVHPFAAEKRKIYRENTREYCRIETADFGPIVQMEVGALLVGRIKNHLTGGMVRRGQEKGMFEFGGSTVILFLEKDRAVLDEDILKNSLADEETVVKMGEKIGTRQSP